MASFVSTVIGNYTTTASSLHAKRDELSKTENAGDATKMLQLLDNQQDEGRVTQMTTSLVSKQNEMIKQALDALQR